MKIPAEATEISSLETYHSVIEHFYARDAPASTDEYLGNKHLSSRYLEAVAEKTTFQREQWPGFIGRLRSKYKFGWFRDLSELQLHSMVLIVAVTGSQTNGACLYLSFLNNYYSLCFVEMDKLSEINSPHYSTPRLSFQPGSPELQQLGTLLTEELTTISPDFELFESEYRDHILQSVTTSGGFKENVTLFEAIFTEQIRMIF